MNEAEMSPEIEKKTIKRLKNLLFGKYLKHWILAFGCMFLNTVVMVFSAFVIRILIDKYITPLLQHEMTTFWPLLNFLLFISIIYVLGIGFNYIYQRLMLVISQGIIKEVRNQMFSHMQKLPISYFDSKQHGNIMSFYTNDVDTLAQLIEGGIPVLISSIVSIILILGAMFYQNIILTVVTIIGVIFMVLTTKTTAMKAAHYFEDQQDAKANLNGFVEEMIAGQKDIKVFNHETVAKRQFDYLNKLLSTSSYQAESHAHIIGPITNNVGHVIYVVVAILGGIMIVKGKGAMTVGIVASFLQLIRQFTNPVSQVTQQIGNLFQSLAGAKRIFSLLDEKPEIDEGLVVLTELRPNQWAWKCPQKNSNFKLIPLKGDVRFNDVSFAYCKGKNVLHQINIYAKPGQKIALVGATGAGKTTITNLLNRFYEIEQGQITYDGIDIRLIKKDSLRLSLGMVLQDTNLFTGTIKENIAYGLNRANFAAIEKAAKLAHADEFIKLLPEGYNTIISGNSAQISQGQKQLLAIARVALLNPPVMILDEATSSIDSRTEIQVQKAMDTLMKNRTVLVIAHRLSTIRNAKAIMVMENGQIIERGNHEELMKLKKVYYNLYMGLYYESQN